MVESHNADAAKCEHLRSSQKFVVGRAKHRGYAFPDQLRSCWDVYFNRAGIGTLPGLEGVLAFPASTVKDVDRYIHYLLIQPELIAPR
jgi:hypothetical protein